MIPQAEPFWSTLFQKVTTPKQLTRRGGRGAGGDLRWDVLRRRSHNLTDLEHFSKEPWGNVAKMRCLTPTDCYHVLQHVFFFLLLSTGGVYLFICLFWLLQLTVTCTILTSGLEMSFEAMHSYEPDCSLVMPVSCKCCPSVTNLCRPAREREKERLPMRASGRKRRPGDGVEH